MTINLHFTSRKNIDKQNYTITRYQISESTWEFKKTNNNNKYIYVKQKNDNWKKKRKLLIKFRFTDELIKEFIKKVVRQISYLIRYNQSMR